MAEGKIHGEPSIEVQTGSACEETLIEEKFNMHFPKIPVQPESSQSRSLSTSGNISSPVFKPRRRRLRSEFSDSEEDEKPEDSTTSDNKDVNPQQFRRRANALEARNVHKRKKVSSA